ncbi:MAG: cytochrome P450 [Sphingobium sp.]
MSNAASPAPGAFTLPAHVPPHLFWDEDLSAFAAQFEDPFVGISALHDGPDIIYARAASRGIPAWVPTRFDIINEIFLDPARFSSAENVNIGPVLGVDWRLNPVDFDPPQHMLYRQVLQPYFQPSAISRYEPALRETAAFLIDQFERPDGCEFISEFASLFPSYSFLDLLGLPRELLPQFFKWDHGINRSRDPLVQTTAARDLYHYLDEYIDQRRRDQRDDLVGGILSAEIKGRPLDHGEVMGMVMLLYFGGLDTVVSSLGWYLRHLAMDQALQQRLREQPEEIPAAVDDLLRAYGVVGTRRKVVEDIEFHGIHMKKDDIILVPGFLASRDDRKYPDPHTVSPDRKARHLSLATGVHNCLGAHLAKREIKIVLEEFLARFKNIRIPPDGEMEWTSTGVWAVTKLSLAWDPV